MSRSHRIRVLRAVLSSDEQSAWCLLSRKQRGEEIEAAEEDFLLRQVFPIFAHQHVGQVPTKDLPDAARLMIMKIALADPLETETNKKRALKIINKIVGSSEEE